MSNHHPSGLMHARPHNFAKNLIDTFHALGLTDEQIKEEMTRLKSEHDIPKTCPLGICDGSGTYFEDIVGDRGPQMQQVCECQSMRE